MTLIHFSGKGNRIKEGKYEGRNYATFNIYALIEVLDLQKQDITMSCFKPKPNTTIKPPNTESYCNQLIIGRMNIILVHLINCKQSVICKEVLMKIDIKS